MPIANDVGRDFKFPPVCSHGLMELWVWRDTFGFGEDVYEEVSWKVG